MINQIYNEDCLEGMKRIADGSVDCILTDPPYKYLKGQKLEVDFDELTFFAHVKRILKPNGFIVLFGRGTSFYRWCTSLADMRFNFLEEIIWDKGQSSSPLLPISRVHETVAIYTKKNGVLNRVKVPYLEMKKYDINSVCQDINRLKAILNNTKSLNSVKDYLENNKLTIDEHKVIKHAIATSDVGVKAADRSAAVIRQFSEGMNEKTIIRSDFYDNDNFTKFGLIGKRQDGDRCVKVIHSLSQGMNEKTIIRQTRDHYTSIHPTQKPVPLLKRLLALTTKPGDLVVDPFSGSGAVSVTCIESDRNYIAFELNTTEGWYEKSVERTEKAKVEMRNKAGLFAHY